MPGDRNSPDIPDSSIVADLQRRLAEAESQIGGYKLYLQSAQKDAERVMDLEAQLTKQNARFQHFIDSARESGLFVQAREDKGDEFAQVAQAVLMNWDTDRQVLAKQRALLRQALEALYRASFPHGKDCAEYDPDDERIGCTCGLATVLDSPAAREVMER